MVLAHKKFYLGDQCLIEKMVIQAPLRFATNFQNEACFIYFAEGEAKINSASEQAAISHRESVLLKCGTYFADLLRYGNADRFEILVFHLYPGILKRIYKNEIPGFLKMPEKSVINKIATDEVVKKFIESLYFYFDHPDLISDDWLELKIKELVLLLMRSKNAESVASLFSDLFTPRNLNIKEVVNNHLFSNLSLDDLAGLCNISLSTFNRTFQTLFSDTPANYIKIKRLERARDLLLMSSLTVREIAIQTCFNDMSHFSRSFRAKYRCSPSEYRMSLKKSKP
jgi:AraC-like DNA-binding protein